jgi:hypothetical protein
LAAEVIAARPSIREVAAGLDGASRPVLVVVAVDEGTVDDETRARGWLQERHPGAEVRLQWALPEAPTVTAGAPG